MSSISAAMHDLDFLNLLATLTVWSSVTPKHMNLAGKPVLALLPLHFQKLGFLRAAKELFAVPALIAPILAPNHVRSSLPHLVTNSWSYFEAAL